MTDAGPPLQEIRAAVTTHLRRQADAELAATRWWRAHPRAQLDDPEGLALNAAAEQAEADVTWCRCVEVAVAEQVKGVSLDEAMAHNHKGRDKVKKAR